MAHQIETMAYVGETPWHGLGVSLPDGASPQEMLQAAGLDWTVTKRPLYMKTSEGKFRPMEGKKALIRESDEQLLDYVGDDWFPTQNHEALDFFTQFCAAGDMTMETAGAIRSGRWVWALAKLGKGFTLPGNDRIEPYLLFSNPHIYGMGHNVQLSETRVVCNNTLQYALGQGSKLPVYRQGHSTKFDKDLAMMTIGLAVKKQDGFREAAEFLVTKRYTDEQLAAYFHALFPANTDEEGKVKDSRRFAAVNDAMDSQPGAEMSKGTFWQAMNAVTFLVDHQVGRSQDTRLASAWYGEGRALKQKAFNTALEMAKAA